MCCDVIVKYFYHHDIIYNLDMYIHKLRMIQSNLVCTNTLAKAATCIYYIASSIILYLLIYNVIYHIYKKCEPPPPPKHL